MKHRFDFIISDSTDGRVDFKRCGYGRVEELLGSDINGKLALSDFDAVRAEGWVCQNIDVTGFLGVLHEKSIVFVSESRTNIRLFHMNMEINV